MNDPLVRLLFLLHLATTFFMLGVIWFVQVVHYPIFAKTGSTEFSGYEQTHTTLTTWVVCAADVGGSGHRHASSVVPTRGNLKPAIRDRFGSPGVTSQKYRLFRFLVRASRDLWAFLLGEGRFPRHSHLSPEDPKYRDEWHGSW